MKDLSFLKDISKKDAALFGGKAASLGELIQANIAVPPGFAISTAAFKESAGSRASQNFVDEILSAFDILKTRRVAVRSSAIAEDSSEASWAGQLESYLNVERDDLINCIQKCRRSINSRRAKLYAEDHRVDDAGREVGVVVQAMVDSEVAGVMFSVDPVSGNKNKMVIEAAFGLGESLVQGLVTPDNFVLTKAPLAVKQFNISVKQVQMVYENGQNQITKVPERLADKASLGEAQVLALAKIGLVVERHYGSPQDIEWAYADGQFYILQSRPITTL